MTEKELYLIIADCKKEIPKAQRRLFDHMYNHGMTVASRFGTTLAESEDIANEGFYKVLKNISKYQPQIPFLVWVRKIIVNCGIDHYRKQKKHQQEIPPATNTANNYGYQSMDSEYLLLMIRSLSPQYRMIFVLHSIEGYSHEEIAKQLNISKGTSKSNLSKARKRLQQMVNQYNENIAHVRK